MRPIWIAVILWAGTIFMSSAFTGLWGVYNRDSDGMIASIIIVVFGLFTTFPMLLPAIFLIRIGRRIPYSAKAKLWWVGFMLLLMSFLFIQMLAWMAGEVDGLFQILNALAWTGSIALLIMIFLLRGPLKKLYSS